jgi:hypothetical protein
MRTVPDLLGQLGPPARDGERVELADRDVAELGRRLAEVVLQPVLASRRALVLLQVDVNELLQRRLRPVERPKARLAKLIVQDRLGLGLRAEPAPLPADAAAVAVPDGPAASGALVAARVRGLRPGAPAASASTPTSARSLAGFGETTSETIATASALHEMVTADPGKVPRGS